MVKIVDLQQREWILEVNVAALRRSKAVGIDLSMAIPQLHTLMFDDVVTIDALWSIVSPNAKERGITQEQFDAGFNGQKLDEARTALWEALSEYYTEGNGRMLHAAVAEVKQRIATAAAELPSGNS